MKKALLTFTISIISYCSFAQKVSYDSETFTYNGFAVNHYGLGWYQDPSTIAYGPMAYLSAFGGIKFFTTGAPKAVLDYNGNFGIGTLTPGAKLDVAGGNINVYPTSNYPNAGTAKQITIGEASDNPLYKLSLGYYQDPGTSVYTGVIQSVHGGGGNNLLLNPIGGNVGVGITNPQNKLDVNGTIHSKAVTVDLTGWPDYVFKPTYRLPTLAEIKTYINQNHHLPEMPSEQEIAKDGINLGEIVKIQTKKIEELTLYLIEKDKQLEIQQDKIKAQEERLSKIEKDKELKKQGEAIKNLRDSDQKIAKSQQQQIDELKKQISTLIKSKS